MQREIKFRAWVDSNKEMVSPYFFVNDENFITQYGSSKPSAVMQFTGLKDKDGAELCESDIIDDHVGRGVVVWWQRNAAFKVSYIGENLGKGKWFADYLDSELKTVKVIGNIYENPELLGETK